MYFMYLHTTGFTFRMTATYTAPYTEEELENLLQEVDDLPPAIDNPGLGLDFSALSSIDNIETVTSLCDLPSPPESNGRSTCSHASLEYDDVQVHHTQKQIDSLQVE